MLDAGQQSRIADLVTIEMEDRQHRSIGLWIEKLVGLPGGSQGRCFRFTITNHAGHHEIWIVERCAEGMAERVTQLAAFMNRSRRCRRDMARDASGEGELLE